MIAIARFGIAMAEDTANVSTGIFLIVVGVIFTPLMLVLNAFGQKTSQRPLPFEQTDKRNLQIYSRRHRASAKERRKFFSQTKADYTYFYKIISTPTHYLMYISNRQCHIIDKSHITQGSCGRT